MFLEPGVVSPDRLVGMIVGEDEQNVRAFSRVEGKGGRGKDQKEGFHPSEPTDSVSLVKREKRFTRSLIKNLLFCRPSSFRKEPRGFGTGMD